MEMTSFFIYIWAFLFNVLVVLLAGLISILAERNKLYAFLFSPVAIVTLFLFFCGFLSSRVIVVNHDGVTIKERVYAYHADGNFWWLAPGKDYIYFRECGERDTIAMIPKIYTTDPALFEETAESQPEYIHVRRGDFIKLDRFIHFPFQAPSESRTTCTSANSTLCWGIIWKGDPFLTPLYQAYGLLLFEPVEYEVDVCSYL